MLHVDVPTLSEIRDIIAQRADACVSIYIQTTPQTQHVGASKLALKNLAKNALEQLERSGLDKRRRSRIEDEFEALAEDDEFWAVQANSLAVLNMPMSWRFRKGRFAWSRFLPTLHPYRSVFRTCPSLPQTR
jgi:hypothetical protein